MWCRDVSFNESDQYTRQALRLDHRRSRCPRISTSTPGWGLRKWSPTPRTARPAGAATIAPKPRWASSPAAASTNWGSPSGPTRPTIPAPIRYEGTGTVPDEGIFRTLAALGRELRLRQRREAALHGLPHRQGRRRPPRCRGNWQDGDGVIFHGTEGWISDAKASAPATRRCGSRSSSPATKQLLVSPEHNRNFIDCVKSRQETICPVEMAHPLRHDLPAGQHRRQDGPGDPVGSRKERRSSAMRRPPRCSPGRTGRNGRSGKPDPSLLPYP